MSSEDFRQLGSASGRRNGDRLFKATVSAYCSITRPTRNDIAQLEEIVLPLLAKASADSKRFAAAALSRSRLVPKALALELCDENVDICAPLLIRADCFGEGDLVTLIARHGTPHAKLIARKKPLHPIVSDLLIALDDDDVNAILDSKNRSEILENNHQTAEQHDKPKKGERGEAVRDHLRGIMKQAEEEKITPSIRAANDETRTIVQRLRSNAFAENQALLQTALADALRINFKLARTFTETDSHERFMTALKALVIPDAEAFVLVSAAFPGAFLTAEAIGNFLELYGQLDHEAAIDQIHAWRVAEFHDIMSEKSGPLSDRSSFAPRQSGGNSAGNAPTRKAS